MRRASTAFGQLTLATCLIAMMAGCTSTTSEWQEEVQLSDGTVLDVHRTIRFEKAGGAPRTESEEMAGLPTARTSRLSSPVQAASSSGRGTGVQPRYWIVSTGSTSLWRRRHDASSKIGAGESGGFTCSRRPAGGREFLWA